MKVRLLRIGAMDYEPLPEVKAFTLDSKLAEELGVDNLNSCHKSKSTGIGEKIDRLKEKSGLTITLLKILD